MMVIFASQSDKNAIKTTRWILDAFADRIGTDTWKTVITEEGLKTVHRLLRNHATKSMAVSCHWLRSRSRLELMWIVGDKSRFNEYGIVPVNSTQNDLMHRNWENEWYYLPAIKALTGVAALFHDWGKSNNAFQKKLKSAKSQSKVVDPYRHEWVSCKLLEGLVRQSDNSTTDDGWIGILQQKAVRFKDLVAVVNKSLNGKLMELPPIASMICWLILTHHRMPAPIQKGDCGFYTNISGSSFEEMLTRSRHCWGYCNDENVSRLDFKEDLLTSNSWQRQLERWLRKLKESETDLVKLYKSNSVHLLLIYARTVMMFSDYWVSAQGKNTNWITNCKLYANTQKDKELKQYLDEHLVRVAKKAVDATHKLPLFTDAMGKVKDVRALRKRSPSDYAWQDKAVSSIRKMISEQEKNGIEKTGWFAVNMASTGCGKTFANAKIMQAMSENGDSLRYTLALGLRTLTLQTGDEYRQRIGLTSEEMAVLIGSVEIQALHDKKPEDGDDDLDEEMDNESMMHGQYDGDIDVNADFLDIFFNGRKNKAAKKNKSLLYAPVLATTIDHIMPAVETIRGGRYLLPLLRMMSSDLVIDEIDDFSGSDLVAIARLVNLAGMFGRKVIISSATIPPDLAEGLFSAYQSGYRCYAGFFKRPLNINCVWSDEFKTVCEFMLERDGAETCKVYNRIQAGFLVKRAEKLNKQPVKRKGIFIDCDDVLKAADISKSAAYFETIKKTIVMLHRNFALKDEQSGKSISIGIVRMANIEPCVQLSKYLLETDWPEDIVPRLMTYHSRQVLLLRHEQEKYLDRVLKRKGKYSKNVNINDSVMRAHIDSASQHNIVFFVVATPVEEVGRDHDFDWAVVEPSSYRSIIQLSGRVLRHRELATSIDKANIAIISYNYKGVQNNSDIVFCRPGFESERHRLKSHNLKDLLSKEIIENGINAVPRILKPRKLCPNENLIDLEHQVMQEFKTLDNEGANYLHGWQDEYWWMTGIPQKLNPFRANTDGVELKYRYDDGRLDFCEYDPKNDEYITRNKIYDIKILEKENERFWLVRNYYDSLKAYVEPENGSTLEDSNKILKKYSEKFGSILLPVYGGKISSGYYYTDQLGLYKK